MDTYIISMMFNLIFKECYLMASNGRTEGSFSKDLSYLKFYTITYKYRDILYVFCKPDTKWTFLPLNTARAEDLDFMGIGKFKSKEEGVAVKNKIPTFEIGGNEVYLEVISNTFMPEMFN
jgi:hypothetical protein